MSEEEGGGEGEGEKTYGPEEFDNFVIGYVTSVLGVFLPIIDVDVG